MVKLASKGRKVPRALPEHSVGDLCSQNSERAERKRAREHKQKWSPKWAHAGNPPATYEAPNGAQKPVVRLNKKPLSSRQGGQRLLDERRRQHVENKRPVLKDDGHAWLDSSAEDAAEDDFNQPDSESGTEPDIDIKYSYDAKTGPSYGEGVLGIAVAKAVERFEDDQTTKLINDEYEVLTSTSEADFDAEHVVTDEDEGFELV